MKRLIRYWLAAAMGFQGAIAILKIAGAQMPLHGAALYWLVPLTVVGSVACLEFLRYAFQSPKNAK